MVERTTTFKDLGIILPNDDKPRLADEKVTITSLQDPITGADVYFARCHRPFLSGQFCEVLNAVAPFHSSSNDISGIRADNKLPLEVEINPLPDVETWAPGLVRLHNAHKSDPDIGPLYMEHAYHHAARWHTSIEDRDFGEIYLSMLFLEVTRNRNTFVSEFRDTYPQSYELYGYFSSEQQKIYTAHTLRDFAKAFRPSPFRYPGIWEHHHIQDRLAMLTQHFDSLDDQLKYKFVRKYIIEQKGKRVALTEDQKILQRRGDKRDIKFTSPDHIQLTDPKAGHVVVKIDQTLSGKPDWHIDSYHLRPNLVSKAIFALIGWTKNPDGTRKMLSCEETDQLLPQTNLPQDQNNDIIFGRALAVRLFPDIARDWPTELPLIHNQRPGFLQKMMGGQVTVWVSLPDHLVDLASQRNILLPTLENVVGF